MRYVLPKRFENENELEIFQHRCLPSEQHPDVDPQLKGMFLSYISKQFLGLQIPGAAGMQVNITNYTTSPILVLDRWNCIQRIPPTYLEDYDRARIPECVQVEMVQIRPSYLNASGDPIYSKYQRAMKDRRSCNRDLWYRNNLPHEAGAHLLNQIVVYRFSNVSQMLHTHGGSFYHEDSGLVFIDEQNPDIVVHPDTPESELKELITFIPDGKTFDLEIYVNDPEHLFDKTYINVGGEVFSVPVRRTPKDCAGVYVTRQSGAGRNRYDPIHEFHALEDEDNPFRLFRSRGEAMAWGDPNKVIDLELTRTKQQHQKDKLDHESLNNSRKQAELEAQHTATLKEIEAQAKLKADEAELERQRVELERAKAEQAQREIRFKQHQEEENRKRQARLNKIDFSKKVILEGAKLLTTAITTAVSLFAWYKLKHG